MWITRWLRCKIIWWLIMKQQSLWLLIGVTKSRHLRVIMRRISHFSSLWWLWQLWRQWDVTSIGCSVRAVNIFYTCRLYHFLLTIKKIVLPKNSILWLLPNILNRCILINILNNTKWIQDDMFTYTQSNVLCFDYLIRMTSMHSWSKWIKKNR